MNDLSELAYRFYLVCPPKLHAIALYLPVSKIKVAPRLQHTTDAVYIDHYHPQTHYIGYYNHNTQEHLIYGHLIDKSLTTNKELAVYRKDISENGVISYIRNIIVLKEITPNI